MRCICSIAVVLSCLPSFGFAQRVRLDLIPDAASANDMSPDGRYVVGGLLDGGTYLWDTVTDNMTTLAPEGNNAVAVSDDGKTVLGNMNNPDTPGTSLGSVAAMWQESTQSWQSLGYLPNALNCPSKSSAYELSADGTVAVGLSWDGCDARAVRWTEATGLVEMESLANGSNRGSVVSADGKLIGGFAQGSFSRTPAIWDGITTDGQLLDPPDGDALGEVHGMSDDGSILLGEWVEQDDPTGITQAVRWTNDDGTWVRELVGNGSFRLGWSGNPLDIADDGTIVGFDVLPSTLNRRGWIQPTDGPMKELNTLVVEGGGTVPLGQNGAPIVLEVPQAISTDGHIIVGHGFGNAWRIKIFSVCDFDDDFDCDIDDIDALVGAIVAGSTDELFDLTGDGAVDLADRDEWLVQAGAEHLTSGNAYLLGDANLDGAVDVTDFNIWNGSKFEATGSWSLGDFNADGSTDISDFNIWNGNKFTDSTDVFRVPEPVLCWQVMWVLSAAFALRRSCEDFKT